MSEWQPIETAPKDGVFLILYDTYQELPVIACWGGDRWRENYHKKIDESDISHWMPLPKPPNIRSKTFEKEEKSI